MRCLIISLFVVVSFTSCSSLTIVDETTKTIEQNTIINPYFSDPNYDYVYETSIEAYGNHFSGILIVKKIGETKHRAVFTSIFGGTLFDFEFDNEKFIVHHVVKQMDKKIIINLLKKDFRALIQEKNITFINYKKVNERIFKTKQGKRYNYYFYNDSDKKLQRIQQTSKRKEKFIIDFQNIENQIAENISLRHQGIKLKMEFKLLKK